MATPSSADFTLSPTRLLARSLWAEVWARHTAATTPPASAGHASWTKRTILLAVQQFMAREGRVPVTQDWLHPRANGLPSMAMARQRWGSIRELTAAAQGGTP